MYGDKVNRVRGILTPHGEKSIRTMEFASEVGTAHAIIMAAAEDAFQLRLQKAISLMPDFDPDKLYRPRDYVVATVPSFKFLRAVNKPRVLDEAVILTPHLILHSAPTNCSTRVPSVLQQKTLASRSVLCLSFRRPRIIPWITQ